MVSPMNPFKKTATDLLDDQLRLEMVEKALEHEPQLKACDYEFRLPKPCSPGIRCKPSARSGKRVHPADWWRQLGSFRQVVPPRRHPSPLSHRGLSAPGEHCIGNVPEGVTIVETRLNISSTEIRKRIKEEESIGEWCRNAFSNWLSGDRQLLGIPLSENA